MKKSTKEAITTYNLVMNFFVEIFVGMGLGYLFGRFLDNLLFGDKVILAFVFLFLGLVSALINFIRKALKTIDGGNTNEKE